MTDVLLLPCLFVQICCTVKDSLVTTLEQLVAHRDRFDYILIETTGLANPGPVVSALWTDDIVDNKLRLDGVVCVVDCLNVERYLRTEDIAESVKTQLCYADRIVLNKVDLIEPSQVKQPARQVCGFGVLTRC
jgi:G3E family GTPase